MTSDETLHLSATRPVLVVTVVHHPEDARIRHREIAALLDAGIPVTYAASFTDHDVHPGTVPGLTTIDLPRAVGRRRLRAARAARAVVRRLAPQHGAVIVHDPELLVALAGLRLPHLIWDVHEDTAAAIEVKGWLPPALRRPASAGVRLLERAAERSRHLLLAEPGYADRFSGQHVVVPNTTTVPATVSLPQSNRVVYLGSVTVARGARVMVELGGLLHEQTDGAVTVEIIGPPRDEDTRRILDDAAARGHVRLHGFVPNATALGLVEGSLAGVSLLQDLPNYRHSTPTKIYEYLARGVPVVTTPLPVAEQLVEASGAGFVVPFDDAAAAAEAVLRLHEDRELARDLGRRGHAYAQAHHDWSSQSGAFVAAVRAVMDGRIVSSPPAASLPPGESPHV